MKRKSCTQHQYMITKEELLENLGLPPDPDYIGYVDKHGIAELVITYTNKELEELNND